MNLEAMSYAELKAHFVGILDELSETGEELLRLGWPPVMKRPLLGGCFGSAGFWLCSCVLVEHGLQQVRYIVSSEHGLFLGMAETKGGAIGMARSILATLEPHERSTVLEKYRALAAAREAQRRRAAEEFEAQTRRGERPEPKVKSIGRRRQRIFDESGGRCHYCDTALTLDGKWHVEHKMPRALGGDNGPGNLVASCVPCNAKKRDTTDVEFKARLARESQGPA